MRNSKYSEMEIVSILKEADAGMPVKEVCRKHGISSPTYYIYGVLPICKRPEEDMSVAYIYPASVQ